MVYGPSATIDMGQPGRAANDTKIVMSEKTKETLNRCFMKKFMTLNTYLIVNHTLSYLRLDKCDKYGKKFGHHIFLP